MPNRRLSAPGCRLTEAFSDLRWRARAIPLTRRDGVRRLRSAAVTLSSCGPAAAHFMLTEATMVILRLECPLRR